MQTQQLIDNTREHSREIERSEEAAIVGEIARRFMELKEVTSGPRASTLIAKMHAISLTHPEALWLVMALLTGDHSEITRSYEAMGKDRAESKQAIEQERSIAMEKIQRNFKHLAKAVLELRGLNASHKQPENDDRP